MKNTTISILVAAILVGGLITVAIAGHHYHGYNMNMNDMTEMDGNQDNLITFDEFSTPHMDQLRSVFKMLDTDNDESISKQEWEEFLAAHRFGDKTETN